MDRREGELEQAYAYDDEGRRIHETFGGTTAYFLYRRPDIIGEYSTCVTLGDASPWGRCQL